MKFLTDIEKNNFKIQTEQQTPRIAKVILRENKAEGIIVLDFEMYYKPIVIKIVWYSYKGK